MAEVYGQGLFTESDYLSLSDDLVVKDNRLIDLTTGAEHKLHYLAAATLSRLSRGVLFHKWLLFMHNERLRSSEIADIINFINRLGGFRVKRQGLQRLTLLFRRLKYLSRGFISRSVYERRPASFFNLLRVVLLGSLLLFLAITTVTNIFWLSGILPVGSALWFGSSFYFLVTASLFGHEYAHLLLARSNARRVLIVAGGLRIGILHQRLDSKNELMSLIIGPLTGSILSIILGLSLWLISHQNWVWVNAGCVVLFNLVGLLPFYGDGRALKNYIYHREAAAL